MKATNQVECHPMFCQTPVTKITYQMRAKKSEHNPEVCTLILNINLKVQKAMRKSAHQILFILHVYETNKFQHNGSKISSVGIICRKQVSRFSSLHMYRHADFLTSARDTRAALFTFTKVTAVNLTSTLTQMTRLQSLLLHITNMREWSLPGETPRHRFPKI